MQCPQCGRSINAVQPHCPHCGARLARTGARIWALFGVLFMLLSIAIAAGAFWFVEHKRALRTAETGTKPIAVSSVVTTSSSAVDLTTLSSEQLLKLVPVNVLTRFKSDAGDNLPDDLRVVRDEADQYLVLSGTQSNDIGKRVRSIVVFKLDGGSLADVSRETLPADLASSRLNDAQCQLRFYDRGADLELSRPVAGSENDLIEECANCEHAYQTEDLAWCGNQYELIENSQWRNDPYTACFLTARALEKRSTDSDSEAFIDESLAAEILVGFNREAGQPWKVQNLTTNDSREVKFHDTITYSLGNGVNAITITVKKVQGHWRATAIERNQ